MSICAHLYSISSRINVTHWLGQTKVMCLVINSSWKWCDDARFSFSFVLPTYVNEMDLHGHNYIQCKSAFMNSVKRDAVMLLKISYICVKFHIIQITSSLCGLFDDFDDLCVCVCLCVSVCLCVCLCVSVCGRHTPHTDTFCFCLCFCSCFVYEGMRTVFIRLCVYF